MKRFVRRRQEHEDLDPNFGLGDACAATGRPGGPRGMVQGVQGLGQFTSRQLVIIGFAVLALFFLHQEGESPAREVKRALRHLVGERAEAYEQLTLLSRCHRAADTPFRG